MIELTWFAVGLFMVVMMSAAAHNSVNSHIPTPSHNLPPRKFDTTADVTPANITVLAQRTLYNQGINTTSTDPQELMDMLKQFDPRTKSLQMLMLEVFPELRSNHPYAV